MKYIKTILWIICIIAIILFTISAVKMLQEKDDKRKTFNYLMLLAFEVLTYILSINHEVNLPIFIWYLIIGIDLSAIALTIVLNRRRANSNKDLSI